MVYLSMFVCVSIADDNASTLSHTGTKLQSATEGNSEISGRLRKNEINVQIVALSVKPQSV